jgi:hypothetical protein
MPIEIVKVQVPLVGDTSMCLVYDKARKHMVQQPLLRDVEKQLNGDAKGYFKGAWSSIVGWGLSERVADQDW